MTDRDLFAAAALAGMLAGDRSVYGDGSPETYCRIAFQYAEAMLREQERVHLHAKASGVASEGISPETVVWTRQTRETRSQGPQR